MIHVVVVAKDILKSEISVIPSCRSPWPAGFLYISVHLGWIFKLLLPHLLFCLISSPVLINKKKPKEIHLLALLLECDTDAENKRLWGFLQNLGFLRLSIS